MTNYPKNLLYILLLSLLAIAPSCNDDGSAYPNTEGDASREDHLLLGNPSSANNDPENYLMRKPEYALSYSRSRGTANWVAWHLNESWNGQAERQNDFRQDPDIPSGWFRADGNDLRGSGFDRGHLCPSADRDASAKENSATFLMTNIIPQAPENNREAWRELEEYCRDLMYRGNELYIVAGVYGQGGSGSNGGTTRTLADGNITVPAQTWKVILIVPEGSDDLVRISPSNTEVIAIDMPNSQSVADKQWQDFRISVDELERRTGYDFFSMLSEDVQNILER